MRILQLWSFSGTASRKAYVLIGTIAFLLKSNVDRVIANYFFFRPWGLLNYWFPFPAVTRPWLLRGADAKLTLALLAVSFPFIWVGMAQTVRRLRDSEQPLWLSVLFFIPFVNLVFFAVLCCWPPSEKSEIVQQDSNEEATFGRRITDSDTLGAAALAIVGTSLIGILAVVLGTQFQGNYGWGLFVAVPVCLGLFSTLIYSYRTPRTAAECLLVSVAPVALLGVGLLLLAFEGAICVLMAAPLGLGLSALGGIVGYCIQEGRWALRGRPTMMGLVLLVMPTCMGLDQFIEGKPPLLVVHSSIEINAPPEVVWEKVVAFSQIPEQREWLFHTGIAYPIRATLTGKGEGAVRRCEFSTGAFVEPIEIWDEPRLLRFGVTENPAPMEELTPYRHIEPPHLKGYFVSHEGQFELARLPGNRTRLTGTTWYTDRIWPSAYWRVWSDYIIHRIHLRVLRYIKVETEGAAKLD
jgi:uncharacterized membrane protein YhaH (DUF805 family)